jgi:hypothetical protein
MPEAFSAIMITGALVYRSLSNLRNSTSSIFEALGDHIHEQVVH